MIFLTIKKKEKLGYSDAKDRKAALATYFKDSQRRANDFRSIITNKKWLDIGTGSGGVLELLRDAASQIVAVEPQLTWYKLLKKDGYDAYQSIDDVVGDDFEVVTLFHLLEHFVDPVNDLKTVHSKMNENGKIIVEVPHANNLLISSFNHEKFKTFTFWSEHLILHTRRSLTVFLEEAGFRNICVEGFQRYSLANHLHWLVNNEPGGHIKWKHLGSPELDSAYSAMLCKLDKTDTLIATAEK